MQGEAEVGEGFKLRKEGRFVFFFCYCASDSLPKAKGQAGRLS